MCCHPSLLFTSFCPPCAPPPQLHNRSSLQRDDFCTDRPFQGFWLHYIRGLEGRRGCRGECDPANRPLADTPRVGRRAPRLARASLFVGSPSGCNWRTYMRRGAQKAGGLTNHTRALVRRCSQVSMNGQKIDDRVIRVDYSTTSRPHTPTPGQYMGNPKYEMHLNPHIHTVPSNRKCPGKSASVACTRTVRRPVPMQFSLFQM